MGVLVNVHQVHAWHLSTIERPCLAPWPRRFRSVALGLPATPHQRSHTSALGVLLQDTEDYDFIEFTVVVKLTGDEDGAPPSEMRVVGAEQHFAYMDAPAAGAAGSFRARCHHASVAPREGAGEHLKIAYFFRASVQQQRYAKRALAAGSGARLGGAPRAASRGAGPGAWPPGVELTLYATAFEEIIRFYVLRPEHASTQHRRPTADDPLGHAS